MEAPPLDDVGDHGSLLESVPVASLITDPVGTILFTNTRLNELFGFTNDDAIGLQLNDLIDSPIRNHPPQPDGLELVLGRRRDGAELLIEVGRGQWSTAMGPLLVYTLVDLTGRIVAEQGRREAERRLTDVVNNTTAVIYAKDVDGKYLMVNKQYQKLFKVTQEDVVGRTDYDLFPFDMAEAFRRNDRAVAASGQVLEIEEDVPHPDGPHTYISVKFPLRDHKDKVIGVAGISTDITDRIERLRVEQELLAAREIQRRLYPLTPPFLPGYDLAGVVYPSHVMCGDYYDFIPLGDDRLVCVVADVTGHGIGPSLEMVGTRAQLRAILQFEPDLERVVTRLNQALVADLPPGSFVSMFLAEIDLAKRQLRYCGAGHEALLVRAAGDAVRLESTDMLLGVQEDDVFHLTETLPLDPNDVLLLSTDGVAETRSPDGTYFGWDGLVTAVREAAQQSAREIVSAVYDAARAFANTTKPSDDVTLLAVKVL